MDSTDQIRPNENVNKTQRLSFSLGIPSPVGKRKSFSRPRTPPPTCEERVHYPIFNPRNPRHNPPLTPSSWHGSGYYIPQAQAPNSRNSVRWMQSLPGRSIRKARSGFLALRSGMQRNQRNQHSHSLNHNEAIPNIWSSSDSAEGSFDQQGEYFPSTISEASTEEDYDFGFGLYRTRCNCSSALFGELDKYIFKGPPITLSGPGRMPEMHMGSCSFADLSPVERPPNSSCQENIQALTAKKSSEKQKSKCHGAVRRVSFQADASNSVDKSSSSSSDNADIPQLGVNLSMESHQLSNKSQPAASSSSNVKTPQESPAKRTGSVDSPNCKEDSHLSHSRESSNNMCETIEHRSDETEAQTEEGTETDILSRLSYRPDLLEAWVADFSSSHQDGDVSVGPSMHSNTHSEGFTSTGPTSVSNNNRSSIEEDILSLTSLSMKDEYFLVDGKTSDTHPGGGDNAIKVEESSANDASIHQVDRSPSTRSQQVREIVGPGGPPPHLSVGNRRENSDSSNEEYLATYSMWQRYYLS
ncbi:hypothetical protein PHISCL_05230 [Aspergillus sclerotialis]|uniref:Uncharacterized protein n=1 Tax=Aspergillus sclerotialis TaxID=2070753 RepID=A0A3A2ZJI1_9EURO|nr:hypothetical protein PHISCL_05230 [Aspergillus sclerotialis]